MSSRKRGQAGREVIRVTTAIQIVPTDMICRVEYVDNRDGRDLGDENKK